RAAGVVRVVGTSSGQSEIVIRARSLNDLGGPPQTRYTFTDSSHATVDQLRETLAEFGIFDPRVRVVGDQAAITIQPVADVVGSSKDVVLVYHPEKGVTVKDVQGTMAGLGRPTAR